MVRVAAAERAVLKRKLSVAVYDLRKFFAMKNTFAGRSPRRRMKYGYHSVPKGT